MKEKKHLQETAYDERYIIIRILFEVIVLLLY